MTTTPESFSIRLGCLRAVLDMSVTECSGRPSEFVRLTQADPADGALDALWIVERHGGNPGEWIDFDLTIDADEVEMLRAHAVTLDT